MIRDSRKKQYSTAANPACARIRRLTAAWIGLLVLVFNIAGGGLLPTRPANATQAPYTARFAAGLEGDRIIICTSSGILVMDRDGTIINTTDQAGGADLCVFCLPMLQGAAFVTVPQTIILRSNPPAPLPHPPLSTQPLRSAGLNLTAAPRGPPRV